MMGRYILSSGFAKVVLLTLAALLGGCGSSANTGDLGKAVFNVSNCGGALSDLAGCDIKRGLAEAGSIDVRAVRSSNSSALQLRVDQPTVVQVTDIGGAAYTLLGQNSGTAILTAFDSSGDVDHVTVNVVEIAQIDYSTLSKGFGTFVLQRQGDSDGSFTLNSDVTNFSLIFAQIGTDPMSLLGRDTCNYQLSTGLAFQAGKDMPDSLQFELVRPATPGNYSLTVQAKAGAARFKLLVIVN